MAFYRYGEGASMVRSLKLRRSARGQECTLEIDGVCCFDSDTVVLAHIKTGISDGGASLKGHDLFSCFACHKCHAVIDGRAWKDGKLIDPFERLTYCMMGMAKTQLHWVKIGLLVIK